MMVFGASDPKIFPLKIISSYFIEFLRRFLSNVSPKQEKFIEHHLLRVVTSALNVCLSLNFSASKLIFLEDW